MKNLKLLFLVLIAVFLLAGCAGKRTDISQEEIVAAYEAAGYHVGSRVYDQPLEYGQIAYVQADHPNGDYIYFTFFETEEDAEAYKKSFHHPVMKVLFSAIFGDPSWTRMEVYGCLVIEYREAEFLDVFQQLQKGNP